MAVYSTDVIKASVKKCLDENESGEVLSVDSDTLSLDDIIEQKIAEAIDQVRLAAPLHLLKFKTQASEALVSMGGETEPQEIISLPQDYLRFAMIKSSHFAKPIIELGEPTDDYYAQQSSEFGGIRSNIRRPSACYTASGGRTAIELFPSRASTLYYVARAVASDDEYEIEDGIYASVVYECSALALSAYKEGDSYSLYHGLSLKLLGLKTE